MFLVIAVTRRCVMNGTSNYDLLLVSEPGEGVSKAAV
jgi:hypothetical protein